MPSRQVVQDIARAHDLLSAANTHLGTLTQSLDAAAEQAHTRAYDPKALVSACVSVIKHHVQATSDADIALDQERSDDPQYLRARDAAAEALGAVLSDTRDSVFAAYGQDALEAVGMSERRPSSTSVDALVAYTRNVIAHMKTATLKPRNKRVKVDLAGLIEDVTAAFEPLEKAQVHVDREARELQDALRVRDAAWTELSTDVRAVGQILEGLFRLARLPELADRLRAAPRTAPTKKDEDAPA